ncbi:MAG: hypothetical protein KDA24_29550, partial [Deltaproteobacteria bacterium]|nr:hypothetical protein [Deltaproteobacteria bacterium]
ADHEADLYPELYGGNRDDTQGTVDIQFRAANQTPMTGATATLDGSPLGARVFTSEDVTTAGNALIAGQEEVVFYGNVAPGNQELTITAPTGWTCFAPETVLVEANTVPQGQVGCRQ